MYGAVIGGLAVLGRGLAIVGSKLPLLGRLFSKAAPLVDDAVKVGAKATGAFAKNAAPLADDTSKFVTKKGLIFLTAGTTVAGPLVMPALAGIDNLTGISKLFLSEEKALAGIDTALTVSSALNAPTVKWFKDNIEGLLESHGSINIGSADYKDSTKEILVDALSSHLGGDILGGPTNLARLGKIDISIDEVVNCYHTAAIENPEFNGKRMSLAFDKMVDLVEERRLEAKNGITASAKIDKKDTTMSQVERTLDLDKLSGAGLAKAFDKATDGMGFKGFVIGLTSSLIGLFSESVQENFQRWAISKDYAEEKFDNLKNAYENSNIASATGKITDFVKDTIAPEPELALS